MLAIPRHIVNLPSQVYRIIIQSMKSKEVIKGGSIDKFESKFAEYIGAKYAVSISSARNGIAAVMKALGRTYADEIIMPAYTFHMVPVFLKALGFKPVFVDVDPDTGNINPGLIADKITPNTKAVLITHMFGQPCRFGQIAAIAAKHNLAVVEDCAHALGSEYHSKKTGSLGTAGIFSFGTGKVIPCFGGGMITTSDHSLYLKLKEATAGFTTPSAKDIFKRVVSTLIYHFFTQRVLFACATYPAIRLLDLVKNSGLDSMLKKEVAMPSGKAGKEESLTNLQAELGLFQLSRVGHINEGLLRNSRFYAEQLAGLNNIKVPVMAPDVKCPYLYYKVKAKRIRELRSFLLKRGIDTKVDDMSFCPSLAQFKKEGGRYPVAESMQGSSLEVPSNYLLGRKELEYIVKCLKLADSYLQSLEALKPGQ